MKHEIKRDARGTTTVTDLTLESVDPNDSLGVEDIMQVNISVSRLNRGAGGLKESQSPECIMLSKAVLSYVRLPSIRGVYR